MTKQTIAHEKRTQELLKANKSLKGIARRTLRVSRAAAALTFGVATYGAYQERPEYAAIGIPLTVGALAERRRARSQLDDVVTDFTANSGFKGDRFLRAQPNATNRKLEYRLDVLSRPTIRPVNNEIPYQHFAFAAAGFAVGLATGAEDYTKAQHDQLAIGAAAISTLALLTLSAETQQEMLMPYQRQLVNVSASQVLNRRG